MTEETYPLRIWQQNLNKSNTAQAALLNQVTQEDNIDILALQEPYIDPFRRTRSTSQWTVVYPHNHLDMSDRTRSVLLIHRRLSTNGWAPVPITMTDISAITIQLGQQSNYVATHFWNTQASIVVQIFIIPLLPFLHHDISSKLTRYHRNHTSPTQPRRSPSSTMTSTGARAWAPTAARHSCRAPSSTI